MNLKSKADKGFLRETPVKKVELGTQVHDSIVLHAADYPNLPVTVVDLLKITKILSEANLKALSGDHTAVVNRNAAEKEWDAAFSHTADYVTFVANGDELKITNAGFKATKTVASNSLPPDQVTGVVAVSASKSNLNVEWKLQKGCSYHCIIVKKGFGNDVSLVNNQILLATPEAFITSKSDTRNKIDFQGLPSLTEYDVVVYAFNAKGAGNLSLPVTVVVI